jgi:galactitol PTS system EIIA component
LAGFQRIRRQGKILLAGFKMAFIDEDCIALNLKAANAQEVILVLGGLLEKKGFVSVQYGQMAVQREQSFPTGVPAQPYSLAFPHADSSKVYRSSLAVATMADPVLFGSMENPGIDLFVSAVFLIASRTPKEQVTILKRFSRFFKKQENLIRLKGFAAAGDLVTWLNQALLPNT